MNKGDKVKITNGPHAGQVGILSMILDMGCEAWYYVRLEQGLVEFHCLENSLEKVQEEYK